MQTPGESLQVLTSKVAGPSVGTVCICTRDHISAQTFMSAMHTDWSFTRERGPITWSVIQGSILTLQRNEAIRQMEGDWLVFIDDDMIWQPGAVGQLVESWEEIQAQLDEPVLMGGLCARRQPPHDPTVYMRDNRLTGRYRVLEKWDTDIVEVDATGLAFLLIPMAALQQLTEDAIPIDKETRMMYEPPQIFRWTGAMGEDLRFCQDMKIAGVRIFVDTRINIGHVYEARVDYRDYLVSLAQRSQEDEDMVREINDKHGMPTMSATEAREKLGWEEKPSTRPRRSAKTKKT